LRKVERRGGGELFSSLTFPKRKMKSPSFLTKKSPQRREKKKKKKGSFTIYISAGGKKREGRGKSPVPLSEGKGKGPNLDRKKEGRKKKSFIRSRGGEERAFETGK